jgi:Asp-tRNA(Asn)/Glu-tRNA(Gln) amidotransferase A subunit family amidase
VLSGSLSTEVDSVFQSAVRELSRLGAEIADVEIPGLLLAQDVFKAIAAPEAAAYHEPLLQENASLYGVDVRERLENGRRVLATDYVRAQRTRGAWAEQFSDVFSRFDAIVTPTLPVVAPRIEECRVAEPVLSTLSRYTRIFNLVGVPAISVPCGFSDAGLPIGLQIAGKLFDEQTILRIACVYEQDTRWFERRPET